ncbi:hypothetical protein BH09PLA1_BH09PLA1_30450 [soil metagenome]
MTKKNSSPMKLNKMSSEAVEKATGKTWPQWLKLLDAAGCREMNHKEIVAVIHSKYGIGPWWRQMVTVGYEQARGMRKTNQKVDGFSFSLSRTIAAPAENIFDAWTKPALLKRWTNGERFEVTTATRAKSVRLKWPDQTRVSVAIYPKGAARAQMVIEHGKIPTATAMAKLKKLWSKRIDELSAMLAS